jgi:hypothetical protein
VKTVKIYYVSGRVQSISVTSAVASQIQGQWQSYLVYYPDQTYQYSMLGIAAQPSATPPVPAGWVALAKVESIEIV